MLRNYFLIALRSLFKNRGTSLINLLGLTIGMASCLLIVVYIRFETSFDQFHARSESLYRVLTIDEALGVTSNRVGITLPALAAEMKETFPEVRNSIRMTNGFSNQVEKDNQRYNLDHLWLAEPAWVEIFDFPFLSGDPSTALQQPNTALISQSTAERIFGSLEVVGEQVEINGIGIKIVGVLENSPPNSHLQYELVMSMLPTEADSNRTQYLNSWSSISMISYVELADPSQKEAVIEKMEALIRANDVGDNFKVTLQAFEDVHLGSADIIFDGYNRHKSDATYVYTLLIVAIFLLLIAAINYMNLATARSASRAREVGLRKVVGARKPQLMLQFISEAVSLALLAYLLSLAVAGVAGEWIDLPMPGNPVSFLFQDAPLLVGSLLGALLLGIAAGSYPAFLLSAFEPIRVLKGQFSRIGQGLWLRRALVILQFTASIAMIIGTIIVYQQIQLIRNMDKGFDPSQILTIPLNDATLVENYDRFKQAIEKLPAIQGIATASSLPGQGYGRNGIEPEGHLEEDVWIVSVASIDENFLPLMEMEMAEGRNFGSEFSTDSTASVLINETMAGDLGWAGDAVGKIINRGSQRLTVVGVIKDFHFSQMRHQIEPMMLYYREGANSSLNLKVDSRNLSEQLLTLENIWTDINPGFPFEYRFFDEEFAQQFEQEQAFASLVSIFTWLAILIACLGLLGLSAYTAEQRTKEIGIRKVLGASTPQLVQLLSKELSLLVGIAAVLASPLAWWIMQGWLEDYHYRIDISWWLFPLAAGMALAIALLTNTYHALKTAAANPVKALRSE